MWSGDNYCKSVYGLVSKGWKYAFWILLLIDVIVLTVIEGCYDGLGDLKW